MAWWTKIVGGPLDGVKKHGTKLEAVIEINFGRLDGKVVLKECGLYKRDPRKYPDEPNLLPTALERAKKRQEKRKRS